MAITLHLRVEGCCFVVFNHNRNVGVLVEKIVDSIRTHDNSPYPLITESAGVGSYPDDAHSFDQLVSASDSALLVAKK